MLKFHLFFILTKVGSILELIIVTKPNRMMMRLLTLFLFMSVSSFLSAQLAIIGQNGETPDELLMVALEEISAGLIFHVTDNEYSHTDDLFTVGEGSVSFVTSNIVAKGDVFSLKNDGEWTIEGSTDLGIIAIDGNLNFSFGNEQSYLYTTSNNLSDGPISQIVAAFDNWDGAMPAEIDPSVNYSDAIVIDLASNVRNATFEGSREFSDLSEIIDLSNWQMADTRIDLDLSDFAGTALPVELSFFEGRKLDNGNKLMWETAIEIDNDLFEIERSTDGEQFEEIDFVWGGGTTFSTSSYEYMDDAPSAGLNYYRLKQIDFNGNFTYSNTIVIENRSEVEYNVFPTVVADQLTIESSIREDFEVVVFDQTGRQVLTQSLQNRNNTIELYALTAGPYYIMINTASSSTTKKIIKL